MNDGPVMLLDKFSPRHIEAIFRCLVFCEGEWWIDAGSSTSIRTEYFGSEEEADLYLNVAGYEQTDECVAGVIYKDPDYPVEKLRPDNFYRFKSKNRTVICRPFGDRPE